MKTVLVAGGAGFLGSWMCDVLVDKGYHVICVDNLVTGRKENIEHLFDHDHFLWRHQDIRGQLDLPGQFDYVMNFACPASPPAYQDNPFYTMETCFDGTLNLLRLASHHNAVYFQASTSEVYGDPEVVPQKEDYLGNVNTLGPRACYDEGKRIAETLCYEYSVRGLRVKIARIFNTYGPRMDPEDGRVVSNFICQCIRKEAMTVHGTGDQTRAFCYVDDMIDGLYKLVFETPDVITGPINLGNPHEMPVIALARLVGKYFNQAPGEENITFTPRPEDDPEKRRPDIALAMKVLNWAPAHDVEVGIQNTIDYFRRELHLSNQLEEKIA